MRPIFFLKGEHDVRDGRRSYEGRSMREPEVSIITAAYNAEKYIAKTIESVQNQTFSDWEHIIVEGGSTDGTVEVIKGFLSDERIKLVIEKRKGRALARNVAFAQCRGKYIANIDADDLWRCDKLAKQVALLESKPNAGLVYTGLNVIDEAGTVVKTSKISDLTPNPLEYLLTVKNPIAHSSVLIRRKAFSDGKYQDEKIEDADELIVYLRTFLGFGEVGFINEPLISYRVHSGSGLSRVSIRTYCREYKKGLDTFFLIPALPPNIRKLKRRAYGTMYYLSASVGISFKNDLGTCARLLIRSMCLRPSQAHYCLFQFARLIFSPLR
jgi:glycosyltransferase involved in cell wall biosynthesis